MTSADLDEGLRRAVEICDGDATADQAQLLQHLQDHSSELADANAYMSTLLETSHDGILVVDAEGRFEYGNKAFFRTVGWPRDELIGSFFMKVIPEDLHEYMATKWTEVQKGHGEPYETEIQHKNGERRALLVSHRHMTIGGARKYCVITKDITDKKRYERELLAHHERLEELVAERTAELEQRTGELVRLAEELTLVEQRERQRVAQYLHDDLQQLLVGARMQAQGMASLEGASRTTAQTRLNNILARAIETTRDMTQGIAPPIALKRHPIDGFRWLLHDAKTRYQLEVTSQVEIGDALENAPEATIVLLFTAARELLLNVVKHAETPHAMLRLTRQPHAVTLEVSDRGCGLSTSAINNTKEQGFGLFSIRERVELLGGSFQLKSVPGDGVTVTVTVPLPMVAPPTDDTDPETKA